MDLTDIKTIKALLEKYGFHFSKSLGQNFLLDKKIVQQIIDAADPDGRYIIEIGPGIGVLTSKLAQKAHQVVAIELDKKLLPVLRDTLAGQSNVCIINDDALKIDFDRLVCERGAELTEKYKVVANLPYYITTPLIFHMLEQHEKIEAIVIMVQKEVAERIAAVPGSSSYGVLSVTVQYYADVRIIAGVSKEVFLPQPQVDSAVISLTIRDKAPVQLINEEKFFHVVKGSFAHRRKSLLNSLTAAGLADKETLKKVLLSVDIDPGRRGETLSMQEFAELSNALCGQQQDQK